GAQRADAVPAPEGRSALEAAPRTGIVPGIPGSPQGPGSSGEPGRPGAPGDSTGTGTVRPLPPEMLQGMLQAARASLEAGRYQEAIAAYKAILKRDHTNVDAITHLGLILAMAGHADGALEAFDRALAIDSDYLEALWYKASVLTEAKRDDRAAIAIWERFS